MSHPAETSSFLKRLTVLYVEDDALLGGELAQFLERRVGRLLRASSGEEGFEVFAAQAPDIVVTDVQMAGLDGLEMVARIRALGSEVPVIITTAFEQTDYLLRAIRLGVDRYVLKPIDTDQLEESLWTCSDRLMLEEMARQRQQLQLEVEHLKHEESLRILLGGIAHDYNNLLQSIIMGTGLAQRHADPASLAAEALRIVERATKEATELSRRLTLIAEGHTRVKELLAVETLAQDLLAQAFPELASRLELAITGGPHEVEGDEGRLRMAFQALVQNAAEAMEAPGRLRVAIAQVEAGEGRPDGLAPGTYVRIRFRDEGHGIPAEILPRIFDPYFSTKNRAQDRGTGLGLALCQSIVRQHGGKVTADSTPGQGATFEVLLPAAPEA